MTLTIDDVPNILNQGYCLWIGAGVTKQLSSIGKKTTPLWSELVLELEKEAKLKIHKSRLTYPERLEIVNRKIGHYKFQILLRKKVLDILSISILEYAKKNINSKNSIPNEFIQLSKLGTKANPIVNFNIETLTSYTTAHSGGPFSIKCFNPPIPESVKSYFGSGSNTRNIFQRHVYHPHGAINLNGTCVLKDSDYKALEGTLSFQLAVHTAFMSHLVIIGMSLDDEYLKRQLTIFRPQIKVILWLTSEDIDKDKIKWAQINDISIIQFKSWNDFWIKIIGKKPQPDDLDLLNSWSSLIQLAFFCLNQNESVSLQIKMFKDSGSTDIELSQQYQTAKNLGLVIDEQNDYDFSKSDEKKILQSIHQRIIKLNKQQ